MMKQKQNLRKRVVSGFTLLEMIVVIAIIAILTGVLVPTMRNYITRSRLNTANSSAKVLFNSLQTIMYDFQFKERSMNNYSAIYGSYDTNNTCWFYLTGDQGIITSAISYENASTILHSSVDGDDSNDFVYTVGTDKVDVLGLGALGESTNSTTIGNRLSRLFTDFNEVSWIALVQGYTVRGVVCASASSSNYVGGYPLSIDEKYETSEIGARIENCTLEDLHHYCQLAWNDSLPAITD